MLQRLGRTAEAVLDYWQALGLTHNETEREFLTRRLEAVCSYGLLLCPVPWV